MLPNTLAKMVSANLYQEILSGNIDESRIDKEIIDTNKNGKEFSVLAGQKIGHKL